MKVSPELKAAVYRVIGEAGKSGVSTEDVFNRCSMAETLVAVSHAIKELRDDGAITHHMSQAGEGKKKHLVKLYTAKAEKHANASEASGPGEVVMHRPVAEVLAERELDQLRQQLEDANTRIGHQDELLKRYEERATEQDITIGQLRQDLVHQTNLVESYQEGAKELNAANQRIATERDEALEKFAERDLTCKMLRNELEGTRSQLEAERQARKNAYEPSDPLGHFRPMFDLAASAGLNYHAGRVVEAICAGAYPLAMNILADLLEKMPPAAPEQIPQSA